LREIGAGPLKSPRVEAVPASPEPAGSACTDAGPRSPIAGRPGGDLP